MSQQSQSLFMPQSPKLLWLLYAWLLVRMNLLAHGGDVRIAGCGGIVEEASNPSMRMLQVVFIPLCRRLGDSVRLLSLKNTFW
jgi:hypothetical protein